MEQRQARRGAGKVAQIFNLPYRRIAFGRASGVAKRFRISDAPQIANLRYSRMQFCATPSGWRRGGGFRASGFGPLSDFGARTSELHIHFPAMLLAWRIIHSSFFGRASAP